MYGARTLERGCPLAYHTLTPVVANPNLGGDIEACSRALFVDLLQEDADAFACHAEDYEYPSPG
jgi:hypothetical protein